MVFDKSIIIKPTGADCNFECDYCFYLKKSALYPEEKKHKMPYDVLEEMIKQVMEASGRQAGFIWQGGEPTLLGIEFFEKVVEFQQKYGKGQVVSNAFQTNGWLLNEDWARLFNRYKFLVGLSLDGPDFVQDRFRKTAGRNPTFERVWNNMEAMRRCNVEFNVLSMVNSLSAQHPEDIYKFFVENNLIYMQFIPILEIDGEGNIAEFSVSPSAYGDFLCRLFDVWYNNGDPFTSIRDFDSLINKEIFGKSTICVYDDKCGQHVVVEHTGDVYACDFFVEPQWRYGNLMKTPVPDLAQSKECETFTNKKMQFHPECEDCKWLDFCYGGCLKYRGIVKGEHPERYYYCESLKQFFEYSMPRVREVAHMLIERYNIPRDARRHAETGRNEPCPCGSGKKYKHCCGG